MTEPTDKIICKTDDPRDVERKYDHYESPSDDDVMEGSMSGYDDDEWISCVRCGVSCEDSSVIHLSGGRQGSVCCECWFKMNREICRD